MKRFLSTMQIKLIAFIICTIVSCVSFSQDYETGIGLRAGFYNGLTIKHFTSDKVAVEGIFSSRWRGFEVTGLYEVHNVAFNTERLKWFFGFGGHIGFWDGDYTYEKWGRRGETYTVIGIDGIIGLEYSFELIPINIGLDWKPAYNIFGYEGFWADGSAFSIRYTF
jgi:hypothetical protein